ncbi:hypothetical protein TorRG33x02_147700, partial [Trema orientale]
VADVLDGGEGEGEALGELDAADDGERDEAVEHGHEAGGAEEEEDGGGGEAGGGDLGEGEVGGRLGDGDGGDGLHGLDRHGDAEEEAGGDVVESGEDEGGAEVEVGDQAEGQDYGDVRAQVADGAGELGAEGGFQAETRRDVGTPLPATEERSGGGG